MTWCLAGANVITWTNDGYSTDAYMRDSALMS